MDPVKRGRGRPPLPDHLLKHPRKPSQAGKARKVPHGKTVFNLDAPEKVRSVQPSNHVQLSDMSMPISQAPTRNSYGNVSNSPIPQERPGESREIQRASFADAIAVITEPERRGEGFRHGWLGNTGSGKTTAIRKLLYDFKGDCLTLIHDDSKRWPQYASDGKEGGVYQTLKMAPDSASVITVRGNPLKGELVEPEELAQAAIKIGMAGIPVRFVIDELDRACSPGGRVLLGTHVRTCLVRGRALQLSVIWSTQAPQRAPLEFVDQSTTIGLCQLGPRALNYLSDRLFFDKDLLEIVPKLKVGEFVLYEQGKDWDRKIYY